MPAVRASLILLQIFHLPDGPEQQRRDREMMAAMRADQRRQTGVIDEEDDSFEGNQNQWADRKKSQEQFGYVI